MTMNHSSLSAATSPAESDEAINDLEGQPAVSSTNNTTTTLSQQRPMPKSTGSRRQVSSRTRAFHRNSSSMSDSTSGNNTTLNDIMNHEDSSSPASYRDYLRAQRSLKSLAPYRAGSSSGDMDSSDRSDYKDDRERERDEAYRRNVRHLATAGARTSLMGTGDTKLWETLQETDEDLEVDSEEMMEQGQNLKSEQDKHNGAENDDQVVEDANKYKMPPQTAVVPWYTPPMQRVFYGKPQVLPHVNWGDLFFDLFFVAAAYNLGALLISALNDTDWVQGLIYFIGIFGSLYQTWYHDLTFSSRYSVLDQFHRLLWGFKFLTVGLAIIFITPLSLMKNPNSIEMLGFILAIFTETLINIGLNLEIYFKAIGDRTAIQNHSRLMILNEDLPALFFYTAALVLAALAYWDVDVYGNKSSPEYVEDGYYRMLAAASDAVECSSGGRLLLSRMLGATDVACPSEGYRKLAAAAAATGADDDCTCHTSIQFSFDDMPMAIVYFAYVFNIVFSFLRQLYLASLKNDIRDHFVPNNLDYVIHRYGEWIMLMVGEGVLSLLIVETTESFEYFWVSGFGALTVMGIHVLIFESQPSSSEKHAVFRSLRAQLIFNVLVQILSIGLIAFGVCFKIMLSTIVSKTNYDSYDRRLAGTPSVSEDTTAMLFSGSLSIVLLSLELMLANHKGAKGTWKRLFKSRQGGAKGIVKTVNKSLILMSLFKIGLILFTATMSQWHQSFTAVSVIAFAIVMAMSVSRIVGWGLVHKEDEIRHMLKSISSAPKSFAAKTTNEMMNLLSIKPGSSTDKLVSGPTLAAEGSEELVVHKEIWDSSDESNIVIDRYGGLHYINQAALNELHYSVPSEILGKNVAMLFGSTDDDGDPLDLKKLGPSSRPHNKVVGQHPEKSALHAKRKDGTEFQCMVGLKPLTDTDWISGTIHPHQKDIYQKRDVQSKKENPKLIRLEKHDPKALLQKRGAQSIQNSMIPNNFKDDEWFEDAFDAILVSDFDGIIQKVNNTALDLFAYTSKEGLLGTQISFICPGLGSVPSSTSQAIAKARRKDGSEFMCMVVSKQNEHSKLVSRWIRDISAFDLQLPTSK